MLKHWVSVLARALVVLVLWLLDLILTRSILHECRVRGWGLGWPRNATAENIGKYKWVYVTVAGLQIGATLESLTTYLRTRKLDGSLPVATMGLAYYHNTTVILLWPLRAKNNTKQK